MECEFYNKSEGKDFLILKEYDRNKTISFQEYKKIKENKVDIKNCFSVVETDGEEKEYRPQDKVGVFPFRCDCGKIHMVIVLPKLADTDGKEENAFKSLDKVSDMAVYAIRYDKSQEWYKIVESAPYSWNGEIHGGYNLILFLILSYISSLEELCKKDFRRYYLNVEDILKAKIKGRLKISSYLNKWCTGKKLDIPCKWNLFTYDNWDNRILKCALKYAQKSLKPGGLLYNEISTLLTGEKPLIRTRFYEVSDYEPWEIEFHKAKLKTVSDYYRNSLNLAELIIKNAKSPANHFQNLKPTYVDMDKLFEMFVSAIAKEAFEEFKIKFQESKRLFKSKENFTFVFNIDGNKGTGPSTKPDITVYNEKNEVQLIIDAKYKEILDIQIENPDKLMEEITKEEKLQIIHSDMYQLFFYMRSRNCKKGIIIYPFWDKNKTEVYPENIEKSSDNKDEMTVTFIGLNLSKNIKDVFNRAKKVLKKFV